MAKRTTSVTRQRKSYKLSTGLDPALDLNPLEVASREKWATTLAIAISDRWSMDVIRTMVAAGKTEFRRVVVPIVAGQSFRQSDIDYIFSILERQVEQGYKFDPRVLLAGIEV